MPRPPSTRNVQVSKKLSWLLRHGIEKEKLEMNRAGYVNVADVLGNRNIKPLKVSLEELHQIVATDNKQRYSLIPRSSAAAVPPGTPVQLGPLTDSEPADPKDYLIRANQGHSVAVESENLLTKIDESNMPVTCVHGTTHRAWTLIASSGGLKRMTRQHVHFAAGLPANFPTVTTRLDADATTAEAAVVSGMRTSSTVLIYLDLEKAIRAGIPFWQSSNGVILTEGDEEGIVPLTFFKQVVDRTGGQGLLVQDGQILKEPPEEWSLKGSGRQGARLQGASKG